MTEEEHAELKLLMTRTGVTASVMAGAVNYMLGRSSIYHWLKADKLPTSQLHQAVLRDILVGLRYAFAYRVTVVKPATAYHGSSPKRNAQRLADAITELRSCINAGQHINNSVP